MENKDVDLKRRDIIKCMAGGLLLAGSVFCSACNKNAAKVDRSACVGCGLCVSVCPHNAISVQNKKAKISSSKCTGCAMCKDACVYGAISI